MSSQDRKPSSTNESRSGMSWDQILHDYQRSLEKLEEDFNHELDVARVQTSTTFDKVRAGNGVEKRGIRIQDLLNAQ